MKLISKLLTNNLESVPLLYIMFNMRKYVEHGAKGSCNCSLHPILRDDEYIMNTMNDLCDYIRENYDMNKLV